MFSDARHSLLAGFVGLAAVALAGCASLPRSGPDVQEIQQSAVAPEGEKYVLVDVDSSVAGRVGKRQPSSFSAKFGDHRPSADLVIGVGDALTVTIWEAGPGGLFSAPLLSDKISAGSNSAVIPEQLVERDGCITVPYAGRIPVAGKTTREVQASVEKALTGKAIQPQVLVTMTHPITNTATVGGDAVQGARVPLSLRGDRVLDVIAAAGGVKAPVHEVFVDLTRGGKTTRVALSRIVADPQENIYVRPGDSVTLVRDAQTYMVLGATGRNAEIPFTTDGATLAEALSSAGGLNDMQADPKGVFVFRYEPASVVRELRPDWSPPDGEPIYPVVYRVDLTTPNSLLLAQKFSILSHDVVYVSDAPAVEFNKLATILNTTFTAVNEGANAAVYAKVLGIH